MARIYFVTCAEKAFGTADDHVLQHAFRSQGHEVEFKVWSDPQVKWQDAALCVIRSTWDYHKRLPEFLAWAKSLRGKTRLMNPHEILDWNSSKEYLARIQGLGLATVPTNFSRNPQECLGVATSILQENKCVILKPAVSATADLTFKITRREELEPAIHQILQRGLVLIQPYIRSIETEGEISLIYFREKGRFVFSHSVQKTPRSEDFRVQSDFGGQVRPVEVSSKLMDLPLEILEVIAPTGLYARVDVVDWTGSPKVGEIEMVEPELFFRHSKTAALRFEKALREA